MFVKKVNKVHDLSNDWDNIANSPYQKRAFLWHLEKTNPSHQRYFLLYDHDVLCAGAVVYSLKINLFTFSKFELKLPMQVLGLPVSNDESGLLGHEQYIAPLLSFVFKNEKGIFLCLNYTQRLQNIRTINMMSLPGMIFHIRHSSWESYISALRHPYRRRILKALQKTPNIHRCSSSCEAFTEEHYNQYLSVLKRSTTKLELLPMAFFKGLPDAFHLNSYYDAGRLLFWNITMKDQEVFYFLFGGLDYTVRDIYDSYFNNLIQVLKDGIAHNCKKINFGQTAEISKSRFGTQSEKRKMFLYHNNIILRWVFMGLKKQLSYSGYTVENRVYKDQIEIQKKNLENTIVHAGIA